MFIIVAFDLIQGIGIKNDLPWNIPEDLKHFKKLTLGCPVIMGRLTAESIIKRLGAGLPGRRNIVLSRGNFQAQGIEVYKTVQDIIELKLETPWVIGGEQIYQLFMDHCTHLYITRINSSYDCNKFFPEYKHAFREIKSPYISDSKDYKFEVWERIK